jgi:hypothetical protein
MNVKEITPNTYGTLSHYVITAVLLTAVTIWIVIAVQVKYLSENPEEVTVLGQLMWPLTLMHYLFYRLWNCDQGYRRAKNR